MEKIKVKTVVDVLMLLTFILVMVSGLNRWSWSSHVFLSWLLVGFVLIHLFFNFNLFKCMLLDFFRRKNKQKCRV